MSALPSPVAVPPVLSPALILRLEETAAKWIAKYPEMGDRIARGISLAKRAGAISWDSEGVYAVRGSKGAVYHVSQGTCTCEDHVNRAHLGTRCKHRFALSLLAVVGATPRKPTPPAPVALPAPAVDDEQEEWLARCDARLAA